MNNPDKIHVLSRCILVDSDQLLVCKTLDLNPGFYYLPGGHVEHGESIRETVKRELIEEAGVECEIQGLLGCLEYNFEPGHSSICHNHEYSFFFQVHAPSLTAGQKINKQEEHIGLSWIHLSEIQNIDLRPEPLKDLLPIWLKSGIHQAFHSEMR